MNCEDKLTNTTSVSGETVDQKAIPSIHVCIYCTAWSKAIQSKSSESTAPSSWPNTIKLTCFPWKLWQLDSGEHLADHNTSKSNTVTTKLGVFSLCLVWVLDRPNYKFIQDSSCHDFHWKAGQFYGVGSVFFLLPGPALLSHSIRSSDCCSMRVQQWLIFLSSLSCVHPCAPWFWFPASSWSPQHVQYPLQYV